MVFNNRGVSGEVLLVRLRSLTQSVQRESVGQVMVIVPCVCACVRVCVSCKCLATHCKPGLKIPQKGLRTAGIELLMLYLNVDAGNSDLAVHVLHSHLPSSVFTQLVAMCRPPLVFVHFGF